MPVPFLTATTQYSVGDEALLSQKFGLEASTLNVGKGFYQDG